jgi:hypothetical protein
MSGSGFALLLGFALLKIALGLTLIYLGLRGGGRAEPDEPLGAADAPLPPRLPARRPRAAHRGGPRTRVRPPRRVPA